MIKLEYSQFKEIYEAVGGKLRAVDQGAFKKLFMPDESCYCLVELGSADETDYDSHIMATHANDTVADASGRQTVRNAATDAGWALLDNYTSLETCIYNGGATWDDMDGTSLNVTSYHYGVTNVLLTTQGTIDTDCVRTDFVFKFGEDIDLDRGCIMQRTAPTADFYLFGAFGVMNGGTVVSVSEFIRNLNLYHCPTSYPIDGKSSKKLINDLGIGLEANQALIRCKHTAGVNHKFQVGIGYYRA